ncbi:sigma factor-like helix-turn-helix DNA-binding protein [Nocardia sp. NPDC049149]|uniref:sigma factor-like helix-turn-helix DNA-binding protein n=1 Tax=Nocardia sp. NPDC049149 TaxID=3364315 RepID=UPI00371F3762
MSRQWVGYSAREVAELMEVTVPAVNSALQRARRLLDERVPEQSQQTALRALGDARVRELVDRYASALERADLAALIGMLTLSYPSADLRAVARLRGRSPSRGVCHGRGSFAGRLVWGFHTNRDPRGIVN